MDDKTFLASKNFQTSNGTASWYSNFDVITFIATCYMTPLIKKRQFNYSTRLLSNRLLNNKIMQTNELITGTIKLHLICKTLHSVESSCFYYNMMPLIYLLINLWHPLWWLISFLPWCIVMFLQLSCLILTSIKSLNTQLHTKLKRFSTIRASAMNLKCVAEPWKNSELPAVPAARYTGSNQVGLSVLNNHTAGLRQLVCV